jgi:hypothetical protein
MLAAWASHRGRKEVATGGAASGCFSRRYGLDARGVEVSEGRDHVSLRVRRPVGFSRLVLLTTVDSPLGRHSSNNVSRARLACAL